MNKVILIGRVGKDPEVRTLSETTMSTFSLATEEKWKDNSGKYQSYTIWHNIQAWRNLNFLKKGMLISLEGKIEYREKDDRYYTNIIMSTCNIIDWNNKSEDEKENQSESSNGFQRLTDDDFRDKKKPF